MKKDRPTEFYGGYNGATVAGFVLVKYLAGKKNEISLVPLKLLDMDKFIADDSYALQYIATELGDKATNIEILFHKRIFKIFTMLSLDGARFCIRGKAGTSKLGLMNMMPFMTSPKTEAYIKKLESFVAKHKKNENLVWDERFDGISMGENVALFEHYFKKLSKWPYNKRPANETLVAQLTKRASDFTDLNILEQSKILLQIQGVFGRIKQADLKALKESPSSGITALSLNLSNWKKNYTDVRIIDQSASGFFETVSDNLLELL